MRADYNQHRNRRPDEDHDSSSEYDREETFYEDGDVMEDEDFDENDEEDRSHLYRRKKGFSWEDDEKPDRNDDQDMESSDETDEYREEQEDD